MPQSVAWVGCGCHYSMSLTDVCDCYCDVFVSRCRKHIVVSCRCTWCSYCSLSHDVRLLSWYCERLAQTCRCYFSYLRLGFSCKKSKAFAQPRGPWRGADLRFSSPQSDSSLHCETTGYQEKRGWCIAWYACLLSSRQAGTKLYCLVSEAQRCK